MEIYPTIKTYITHQPIIAFDKIDGSNIRAEWNPKTGFNKFGSRKRLLSPDEEPLGEAIELFKNSHAETLDKIFRKQKYVRATAFMEFAGKNSFAGHHIDEEHNVRLFDVHVYKKGILLPDEFLKLFADKVDCADVLFEGIADNDFIEAVKDSTLPGMTFEGVVCKGGIGERNKPVVFKIKSRAWLDALKVKYSDDPVMFEQLK